MIITVVAMQSISFSHVHLPGGPEDAEHHSGQPHFHVHGGHSHTAHSKKVQHKNEHESAATLHEAHYVDHDLDACYLPDSLSPITALMQFADLRLLSAPTLDIDPERFDLHALLPQQHIRQFAACSGSTARVPLYLRSLAILC
ncbi:MAG: hypothetical protein JNL58_20575 [Planctomyces sp.]|nr:hypothetical protein [Planctomyces sp.]